MGCQPINATVNTPTKGTMIMSCDTRTLKNQTLTQRKGQVREAIARLNTLLMRRQVKPVIGPQGAIAFQGWSETDRGMVSDACGYRMIMSTGSALARAEIARAEAMAGRTVDRAVIGQGGHYHGETYHAHKG
jgi:Flp pilus assembly protein TadD